MTSNANPLVPVLTLLAAMGGGALGTVVVQPEGGGEAQLAPDVSAVTRAVDDLRDVLDRLEVQRAPVAPPLDRPEGLRREVAPVEPEELPELDELRSLIAELRRAVSAIPAADPPPLFEFQSARPTDTEAVKEAMTRSFRSDAPFADLVFEPYQVVLARFGRPAYIDDGGGWAYRALSKQHYYTGIAVTIAAVTSHP